MYIIFTYNYNIDCKPSIFRILLRSQKSHQFTYYFTQHREYAACASRTSRMCLNSRGFQEDAKHLDGALFHPWCAAKLSQAAEWHFWRFCTGCCRCSCGGRGGGRTMITAGTTAPGLDSKTLGKSWQVDEATVSFCEGYFRFDVYYTSNYVNRIVCPSGLKEVVFILLPLALHGLPPTIVCLPFCWSDLHCSSRVQHQRKH